MKTRVTEHFDNKLGIYCYWVWKWALWDPPDLRRMYPTKFDWRHVIYLPDRERAITIARQLSEPPGTPKDIPMVDIYGCDGSLETVPLVAEFGDGN